MKLAGFQDLVLPILNRYGRNKDHIEAALNIIFPASAGSLDRSLGQVRLPKRNCP